jgi:hypothetical protein
MAGCGQRPDGPGPTDPTTGLLQGVVLDDGGFGLQGANVRLLLTEHNTTTDAGGAFVFDGAPAGSQRLVASLDGHATATRNVFVPPAGVLIIQVHLSPAPRIEPYHRTIFDNGRVACGLPQGIDCTGTLPESDTTFHFEVEPHLAGMIVELTWVPAASAVAQSLAFDVLAATESACGTRYAGQQGQAPVRLEVSAGFPITGGHQCVVVRPTQEASTIQQDYTIYVSLFYRQAPPADFTAVP